MNHPFNESLMKKDGQNLIKKEIGQANYQKYYTDTLNCPKYFMYIVVLLFWIIHLQSKWNYSCKHQKKDVKVCMPFLKKARYILYKIEK